jgi:hypothetical protein
VHVFAYENGLLGLLFLALVLVKGWAMVDALLRPAGAFPAVDKLTKAAWLWILGLGLATHLIFPSPLGLLSIAGTIGAFVYLLDVRPAVASVTRRR